MPSYPSSEFVNKEQDLLHNTYIQNLKISLVLLSIFATVGLSLAIAFAFSSLAPSIFLLKILCCSAIITTFIYPWLHVTYGVLKNISDHHRRPDYQNGFANFIGGLLIWRLKKLHGFDSPAIDLPQDCGLVIVSNHPTGALDAAAIMASINRPAGPLATAAFNKIPFLKQFLELFGAVFIDFTKKEKVNGRSPVINTCVDKVKAGQAILLFPFGAIHPPGNNEPNIISGAERIVRLANEQLIAEGKAPTAKIVVVFVHGVNPEAFDKPIGSMFYPSNTKVKKYLIIDHAMTQQYKIGELTEKVIKPYLSCRFTGPNNDRFMYDDDAHNNFAKSADEYYQQIGPERAEPLRFKPYQPARAGA